MRYWFILVFRLMPHFGCHRFVKEFLEAIQNRERSDRTYLALGTHRDRMCGRFAPGSVLSMSRSVTISV